MRLKHWLEVKPRARNVTEQFRTAIRLANQFDAGWHRQSTATAVSRLGCVLDMRRNDLRPMMVFRCGKTRLFVVAGPGRATKFFGRLLSLDFRNGNIWSGRSAAVSPSTSRSTANFKDRSHWPRAAAGLRHSRAPLAPKNFVMHPSCTPRGASFTRFESNWPGTVTKSFRAAMTSRIFAMNDHFKSRFHE